MHSESSDLEDNNGEVREQDRYLPIANINRIMKKALPANAKIAKEAKETVQECVSEFISFITSESSDKLQQDKRKTINGDDLLYAMRTLGFEKYVEPLTIYLQKYREATKTDKGGTPSAPKRLRRGPEESMPAYGSQGMSVYHHLEHHMPHQMGGQHDPSDSSREDPDSIYRSQ